MAASNSAFKSEEGPKRLVQSAAARLRDLILAREPGAQIGSLSEVSELLGVGIVTVQQAARILEHEGLLDVRRGPGGGYYGARPDEAALERSVATYMRVHGVRHGDGMEILSMLDCEIAPAAAQCNDESLRADLRALFETIDACDSEEARIAFENDSRRILFKMDARPLFELIARVGMQLFGTPPWPPLFVRPEHVAMWKEGKRRILGAILAYDPILARFEADRFRQVIQARLRELGER